MLIPYRLGSEYTNIWHYIKPYQPVLHFLLYPWSNFDGVHYLDIAGNGYTTNARFMPFYPMIIKLISIFLNQNTPYGVGQFFIAFLMSNLFFLAGLFILYKLVRIDYSKKITYWTIIFLLVFPTSFFFGAIYSESLFLLLIILSFYFARRKNWFLAGAFAGLSSLTRIVGIIMFFALLVEFYLQKEKISLKNLLYIAIAPVGTIVYTIYNKFRWGNFFYFWQAQGELANGRSVNKIIFFPQTIFRYFKILAGLPTTQYEWWIALLELLTFLLVFFLLFLAWKKKVRLSYLIFSLGCFLIPTLSGTFSGLPRYVAPLFPIYLTLAVTNKKIVSIIYVTISIIVSFILLMFFSRGYFVA